MAGRGGSIVGGLGMVIFGLNFLREVFCDYTTVSAKNLMSETPILILGLSPKIATDVLKDNKDLKQSVDDFISTIHALNYGDPRHPLQLDAFTR